MQASRSMPWIKNIIGISDVDTRALVRHIREKGAMNAVISSDNQDVEDLKKKSGRSSPHGRPGTFFKSFNLGTLFLRK